MMENSAPMWTLAPDEVLQTLDTPLETGLSQTEAERRLAEHGPNELTEQGLRSPWRILGAQFTEVMVVVLIVAAAIAFAVGDLKDTIAILVIVVLNAVLGFTQEYRAERAMAALKQMAVPRIKVRRDGQVREISARELVPGDLFLLETGGAVPVDGRLLESVNLRVQEAALTGESEPVNKSTAALDGEHLALGDRRNMVFLGTAVTYGRGLAVVTSTGMETELGHIATMIQSVETERTPLQRRMTQLGKGLAATALALVGFVFALGLLQGTDITTMFMVAISLAVAAVPEGLPAVVTIALALGAQRMLKRRALIRRLPAVETLGSVTVICSDKTGTLTENRMTVTILDVAENTVSLDQQLCESGPLLRPDDAPLDAPCESLALLLTASALCNDATLEAEPEKADSYRAVGDPTEGALVVAAARMDLWKRQLETALPRVAEAPFTSERKRMTTVHSVDLEAGDKTGEGKRWGTWLPIDGSTHVAFAKGAVDSLLEISTRVWVNGQIEPLNDGWRRRIEAANDRLAQEGMRVLGGAFRPLDGLPASGDEKSLERDMIFVGMTGMIDPPRQEVRQAIATCRTAGIRTVMITGDHPLTAASIARDLRIADPSIGGNGTRVITGTELAQMSTADLEAVVQDVSVYARVSPEHKLKIVEALQKHGHIAAMTGDGVNDAPALKQADIGVAMGITGTDVSKEAADMVLTDDNFATIVASVEEGRTIYDNIRKFIKYTLSSNVGEIAGLLVAIGLGLPIPRLLPLQILWMNLVTDGLPGLALGVDPPDPDVMNRPPHPPQESIFARGMWQYILWVGVLMGLITAAMQYFVYQSGNPAWRTMVFTTLCLAQMGNALAIRSDKYSLFSIGVFTNPALVGAVVFTFALQLAVVYVPFLQTIFQTVALSLPELVICLVTSTLVFWAVEAVKWIARRR
ncbi:MAG: cation-translocating P-type ATPase [Anaerolineae bacterium]|nr:cation-translocating P-type ATPase [Anaerolineae bacterium]